MVNSPIPKLSWCQWPKGSSTCLPMSFNKDRFFSLDPFNSTLTIKNLQYYDDRFFCHATNGHSFDIAYFKINVRGSLCFAGLYVIN